jgi:hypothetical protein
VSVLPRLTAAEALPPVGVVPTLPRVGLLAYGPAAWGQDGARCLYGNWCGPGCGHGKPKDRVDECCKVHDECYRDHGYFYCNCDRELAACVRSYPFYESPWADLFGDVMAAVFDRMAATCGCPEGERKCHGACVKPCGPGKVFNSVTCRCENPPGTHPPDPGSHPPPCDAPYPNYMVIDGTCVPSCGVAASHAGGPPGKCALEGNTTICAGQALLPSWDCPICCTTIRED